jgi:hypothetical protein
MEQTNRTILFERLNARKESLISLIEMQENRESLSDLEMKNIRDRLEVGSYEEMVEKFQPEIYMRMDTDQKTVEFFRTYEFAKGESITEIPLCAKEAFVTKVIELMKNKKQQNYVLSSFQEYCENMLPSREAEPFYELRKELFSCIQKRQTAAAKKRFAQLVAEYDEGIFLLKTFLKEMERLVLSGGETSGGRKYIMDAADGEVTAVAATDSFKRTSCATEKQRQKYNAFLEENLKNCTLENNNLFLLLLKLECGFSEQETEICLREYNAYLTFYRQMLQKLWWTAKPMYENLLGIYSFFEQYDHTNGSMPPRLVIVNETLQCVQNGKNKELLSLYLETANEKNAAQDVIWYAIIPGVPFLDAKKKEIRQRFLASANKFEYQSNEENDILRAVQLLADYRVHCFVSASAVAQSTFLEFAQTGYEQWEKIFDFLNALEKKDYVSPCFPNFTLIPKAFTRTKIGREIAYDTIYGKIEIGQKVKLWFDDMNIEAAYVAAGLFAAAQCPDYLKKFFPKNTTAGMPGVAYRICSEGHQFVTTTQMFHEVVSYSKELTAQIERRSTGVVFAPCKGKVCVLTDRVFSYSQIKPDTISVMQTATYMERTIRRGSQDFKEHLIREFFQERPGSLISQWKKNGYNVNSLIKEGESIRYTIDAQSGVCRFEIQFLDERKDHTVVMNK